MPHASFARRLVLHLFLALALLTLSLLIGMAGYVYFEQLHWVDAFLSAAMLLGGRGAVHLPLTAGGKLFAGLVFIVTAALLFTPVMRRLQHKLHWD